MSRRQDIQVTERGSHVSESDYLGSELEVFRLASNWKNYWRKALSPYLGRRVLDVGAGIGATAENLAGGDYNRWIELEPDVRQAGEIRRLRDAGRIPPWFEVREGTLHSLSEHESFDTILYIDVLEHIEDDTGELWRASTHLEPGGNIVVLAPAHQYLYSEFDRRIGHFRRYNAAALRRLVPDGLKAHGLRYLDSVGMLANLANRMLLRSGCPTSGQIRFWDSIIVPVSRVLDPVLLHRVGKSIICVFHKPGHRL